LKKEAQEHFNSTKDPNKSKSSFGFVYSSIWILITFVICLCHIPRCTRTSFYRGEDTTFDSKLFESSIRSWFDSYILPDFNRTFGVKLLSSWFSKCYKGVSPLYALSPDEDQQSTMKASSPDEIPMWLLEFQRKKKETQQKVRAKNNKKYV
jgi:uncharacterized short protein YbdD (DUF466 family)